MLMCRLKPKCQIPRENQGVSEQCGADRSRETAAAAVRPRQFQQDICS